MIEYILQWNNTNHDLENTTVDALCKLNMHPHSAADGPMRERTLNYNSRKRRRQSHQSGPSSLRPTPLTSQMVQQSGHYLP
ncbi:hypothetical protein NEOLEDRAFT_1139305 [Neolentinus lepideus HHB14362 ss-1]|uniref:Uncharacterized protein n=1 Tax=Neolentinus lepideus HHB14362 ss-1 TaxID=1314782 RepID=A0A165PTC5_9AGAM|nr:hypothetical protein NEOLEDRAFT_1139305 [Neolentinus lepideus HHB14362 ss-1]